MVIPVQIAKEPISTKGPRLSADLSIAGRYIVLVPFSNVISISKKIKSNTERNRLKKIIESIKPKNFGVIIRTVSEGKGVAELQNQSRPVTSGTRHLPRSLACPVLVRSPSAVHPISTELGDRKATNLWPALRTETCNLSSCKRAIEKS